MLNVTTTSSLGDLSKGRPNLGKTVHVAAYRLMHFSLAKVLDDSYGHDLAIDQLRKAGFESGTLFASQLLNCSLPLYPFIDLLQRLFIEMGIGVLRTEAADAQTLAMTLSIEEDLECSGMPDSNTTQCFYDEGFLSGIFTHYAQCPMVATEIECWTMNGKNCRFTITKP